MGGGPSTQSDMTSLNKAITDVVMETVQDCQYSVDATLSSSFVNKGFVLFASRSSEQHTEISSTCFDSAKKEAEIQNQIVATISNFQSSSGVGLLGAFNQDKTTARTTLDNLVKSSVKMSNIQKNYSNIKARMKESTYNTGTLFFWFEKNVQGAELFAAATLEELNSAKIMTRIEEHLKQENTSKMANPLDFIANAINAIGSSMAMVLIMVILLVVIGIVGIVVVMRYLTGSTSSDTSGGMIY